MKQILAALALVFTTTAAASPDPAIDRFVAAELPESGAPGMAYAVVDGEDIVAQGYGVTRSEGGESVTADTLFQIGSVTKGFTALAIMQLVEQGEVALDAPVATYLPAFAAGSSREVTILQLLNHTSGFSTVLGNSLHGEESAGIGLIDHAGRIAEAGPSHAPGSAYEYSNANYQVLGAVIEQVSGMDYADYMTARVFQPLGMASTTFGQPRAGQSVATGHRPWFGGFRPYDEDTPARLNAPAGGIWSSASDMALYLAMLVNDADDVLSAEGKAVLLGLHPDHPDGPLGWNFDAETRATFHTGLVPGMESLAMLRPADGKSVIVLVNSNSDFGFNENGTLRSVVARLALGMEAGAGDEGGAARWTYLSVAVLVPLFVVLALISWRGKAALRAKRESRAGLFSLWFPLLAMGALAWVLLQLVPRMFGGSLATMRLYQPDFGLLLIAGAVAALAWAAFRLTLAYKGKPNVAA